MGKILNIALALALSAGASGIHSGCSAKGIETQRQELAQKAGLELELERVDNFYKADSIESKSAKELYRKVYSLNREEFRKILENCNLHEARICKDLKIKSLDALTPWKKGASLTDYDRVCAYLSYVDIAESCLRVIEHLERQNTPQKSCK